MLDFEAKSSANSRAAFVLSTSYGSRFFLTGSPDESDPERMNDAMIPDELEQASDLDELFEKPLALTSFMLKDDAHRRAFLREFCKVGEPALFEAVSHIWSSLAEPRNARCIAMGIAAGTGGKGKMALVRLLRACLKDILAWGAPLPTSAEYASLELWHEATMVAFEAEQEREEKVYEKYAAILNGELP